MRSRHGEPDKVPVLLCSCLRLCNTWVHAMYRDLDRPGGTRAPGDDVACAQAGIDAIMDRS